MRCLALTLVASALLTVTASPAWAACNPKEKICINQSCDYIGTTMLDYNHKNIVACLWSSDGTKKVWKGNTRNTTPTITTYARRAEGTSYMGKHEFCALTRTASLAWGSATSRDCNVTRQADGTWTMYAHFQRNAEIMSPDHVMCSATCLDNE